jgi:alpha-1,2-mannosyltransferase
MYTTTLACAYAFETCSSGNYRRTLASTLLFALGGIVGWPFALALAIPFVFEELFVSGGDIVMPHACVSWMVGRFRRLIIVGLTSALILARFLSFFPQVSADSIVQIPVICIDSLAYGKPVIVPWHIIKYNIFGGSERGPTLYGSEPWYFYLNNLILNFNMAVPLALVSFTALTLTYVIDRRRLGFSSTPNQSSHFTLLALRLAPFYIWLGILTMQPHKEERFMYPVYPLLCFNAAVATYLIRGWMEVVYIKVTRSPYRVRIDIIYSQLDPVTKS